MEVEFTLSRASGSCQAVGSQCGGAVSGRQGSDCMSSTMGRAINASTTLPPAPLNTSVRAASMWQL
jgi:hypothetical protein